VGPAAAHPVTVGDTSRADWFAKGAPQGNIGEVARDAAGRGEFVWTDTKGDERAIDTPTGPLAREADLTRFSVTADATNIYFLAKVDRYSAISNNPALQVMISIDSAVGGQTALPDGVATNVASAAAWESVVSAKFAPGTPGNPSNTTPTVFLSNNTSSAVGSAQLVSSSSAVTQGGFAEISVPWAAIGGMPAPQNALRFTVSTYYSDHSAPSDGNASKAIDVIGINAGGTLADLGADSTIKSFFDVHFSATGEVFAPLQISEFLPDPTAATDPKGEWIEIYNPNSFAVSLNGYKIGDQPYRGGSQGMVQLPNQSLAALSAIVVANDIASFRRTYSVATVPDAKLIEMNSLPGYTSWASGKISLQNQNSGAAFKESIALLDPTDTIVDLVQYAYKTTTPAGPTGLDPDNKPILLTGPNVAPNASYDRCPSGSDTNDSGLDFFVHTSVAEQTPGVACTTVPGIDLRIAKTGPESVDAVAGAPVQYTISYSNAGASAANSVVITDTLPAELNFVGQTSTGATFAQNGQNLSWTLTGPLASQGSGTIVVDATLKNLASLEDLTIVNSAGISSTPSEAPATVHNNVATQTLITAGAADVTVNTNSTWAAATGTGPGKEFSFTINYGNFGQTDANDITITDVLPANVTFVSASVTPATNNPTTHTLTWSVPSLAYLESGSITLVVRINNNVATGAQLVNNVSISSNPADLQSNRALPNSEQATLTVGQRSLYLPLVVK
jgi:uncharacterized repeat protein (TIGR01451 family)